ncbi:MAG: slyX family protein [Micavibrio sp.]|nr:slyX family protein [Micavibrio sp.]|tara:strand:+ start:969 stop:1187 length:219 start_codon:yes stop_codon:yes gene_type:complete
MSKLEEIVAHQSKEIDELNEIVTTQWAEIEAMKKRLKDMDQRLQALRNDHYAAEEENLSVSEIAQRDRPPHY